MQRPKDALPNAEAPTDPTRVKSFARFFKNYMSISAVLAAALPIPVTSFKLIPTYQAQTSILATYTSMFCFLLLGFIFYSRHALARLMFPEFLGKSDEFGDGPRSDSRVIKAVFTQITRFIVTILPALLILASVTCVSYYHGYLDESVSIAMDRLDPPLPPAAVEESSGEVSEPSPVLTLPTPALTAPSPQVTAPSPVIRNIMARDVLASLESWEIPLGPRLMRFYLGVFVFAEAAFIVMALKEYLQDLVKLTELDLIEGKRVSAVLS